MRVAAAKLGVNRPPHPAARKEREGTLSTARVRPPNGLRSRGRQLPTFNAKYEEITNQGSEKRGW